MVVGVVAGIEQAGQKEQQGQQRERVVGSAAPGEPPRGRQRQRERNDQGIRERQVARPLLGGEREDEQHARAGRVASQRGQHCADAERTTEQLLRMTQGQRLPRERVHHAEDDRRDAGSAGCPAAFHRAGDREAEQTRGATHGIEPSRLDPSSDIRRRNDADSEQGRGKRQAVPHTGAYRRRQSRPYPLPPCC